MTLILTCGTREVVVQVSDRRLTLPDGGLFDDNTTKAVCYCGRVAIGYTGVAKIQGLDTAEWIAKTVAPHDQLEPALAAVAASLAPIIGTQRIAIVASGWATLEEKNPRAFACTISNFQDEQGGWLPKARPQITRRLEWLDPGEPYLLSVAGQQLTATEQTSLDQKIRQALKEKNIPFGLAEALGEQVRRISDDGSERGKRVGKGLIVQALSRTAVERQLAEGEVQSSLRWRQEPTRRSMSPPMARPMSGNHRGLYVPAASWLAEEGQLARPVCRGRSSSRDEASQSWFLPEKRASVLNAPSVGRKERQPKSWRSCRSERMNGPSTAKEMSVTR